jgi:hypothetical protein
MHSDLSGTVAVMDTKSTEVPVCGFLHTPACASSNGLVLTHGAGAKCDSPLLVALATALCASGLTVLRCDLPFRRSRPHGPPPRGGTELDPQGLRAAVSLLKRTVTGRDLSRRSLLWWETSLAASLCGPETRGRAASSFISVAPTKTPKRTKNETFPLSTYAIAVHSRSTRWVRHHRRDGKCVESHTRRHSVGSGSRCGTRTAHEEERRRIADQHCECISRVFEEDLTRKSMLFRPPIDTQNPQ